MPNEDALGSQCDIVLPKFVNLPHKRDADMKPAEEFRERFGDLFPGCTIEDYRVHVSAFRRAWQAKTESDQTLVNNYMRNVLNRSGEPIYGDYIKNVTNGEETSGGYEVLIKPSTIGGDPHRPAVMPDFSTGKIKIEPETLLDLLVSWLLEYQDKLAICAWKGCKHPYYVKTHGRQNFCCHDCANYGRKMSHLKSWHKNKKKWRKQHKTARRHSKARSLRAT